MAKTVQELIREAKIVEKAQVGRRLEKIRKVQGVLEGKSLKERIKTKRVSPSIRKADTKVSDVSRKLVHLASPKGGFVKAVTKPKGKSKGRGRPTGTFKTRVLPSGRVVKVHTEVYKKLLSQEKAQMRLAKVQRQFQAQQQADQVATQQDPRFQHGAEDQFLAEQDQIHEMNVLRAQQEGEMAQFQPQEPQIQQKQQGVVSRAINGINRLGGAGRARTQQVIGYDEYGRPIMQQMQQQRPQIQDMRPKEPRVSVLSDKSSILNAPNIFNNPGESTLSRRGRL